MLYVASLCVHYCQLQLLFQTNTQAFYAPEIITAVKSLKIQAFGACGGGGE